MKVGVRLGGGWNKVEVRMVEDWRKDNWRLELGWLEVGVRMVVGLSYDGWRLE